MKTAGPLIMNYMKKVTNKMESFTFIRNRFLIGNFELLIGMEYLGQGVSQCCTVLNVHIILSVI